MNKIKEPKDMTDDEIECEIDDLTDRIDSLTSRMDELEEEQNRRGEQ